MHGDCCAVHSLDSKRTSPHTFTPILSHATAFSCIHNMHCFDLDSWKVRLRIRNRNCFLRVGDIILRRITSVSSITAQIRCALLGGSRTGRHVHNKPRALLRCPCSSVSSHNVWKCILRNSYLSTYYLCNISLTFYGISERRLLQNKNLSSLMIS